MSEGLLGPDEPAVRLARLLALEGLVFHNQATDMLRLRKCHALFVVEDPRDFLPVYGWLANHPVLREFVVLTDKPEVAHLAFDILDGIQEEGYQHKVPPKVIIEDCGEFFKNNPKRFDMGFWISRQELSEEAVARAQQLITTLKDGAFGFFTATKGGVGPLLEKFLDKNCKFLDAAPTPEELVSFGARTLLAGYIKSYGETQTSREMRQFLTSSPSGAYLRGILDLVRKTWAYDIKRALWLIDMADANCLGDALLGVKFGKTGVEVFRTFEAGALVGAEFIIHRGGTTQSPHKFKATFQKNVNHTWASYLFKDPKVALKRKALKLLKDPDGRTAFPLPPALIGAICSMTVPELLHLIDEHYTYPDRKDPNEWMSSSSIDSAQTTSQELLSARYMKTS